MRNVVASNLAGRGIKLHPERNPVKASIPLPAPFPALPALLDSPNPLPCWLLRTVVQPYDARVD